MKPSYKECEILLNKKLNDEIYLIKLKTHESAKPGQFYMIRGWEGHDPYLSRPISIHSLNNEDISFLYQVKGKGTHIISKLKIGEKMSILGPLGNGFELEKDKKIAIVAGGIGIAPLVELYRALNRKADFYAGFRASPYAIEEVDNIELATEDGSVGHKGFVTDIFYPTKYDTVYACGPNIMLEALKRKCKDKTKLIVSLESNMACGIGACLGCTVETTRGLERVCKEGPVFNASEVTINA